MTAPGNAVFLSYASQDAEAALHICGALRAAGVEVWFDQSELRGGDAWDQMIRRQIRQCTLFIAVISAHTDARPEGYFRREWRLAVERAQDIADDEPFLIPVLVDSTSEATARVPDRFRAVQWTRVPDGYGAEAFVERVSRLLSSAAATPSAPGVKPSALPASLTVADSDRSRPPASRSFAPWIIGAVVVIAIGYFVTDRFWLSRRSAVARPATAAAPIAPAFNPPAHSIAVLPFVNMSGDSRQEYFSDGITEELLNSLSRLNDLEVVARTSSFSFKGKDVDVSTIAHKLNVGAILEGSVRRAGNTVRITVQLINAVSGFHMWSQTYDRNLSDVLKVQTDVATAVAEQLEIKLVGDEATRIELGGTRIPEAYDAYLRAEELLSTGDVKEVDLRAALAALDQAIALDPSYAIAQCRRAAALGNLSIFVDLKAEELDRVRGQALQAAERAVALAPDLGEAHLALALARAYDFLDFGHAAPEFDQALALAPGSARVQAHYAGFAGQLGHFETAVNRARRAVTLDPQNIDLLIGLGQVLSWARRYNEALTVLQAAKALRPSSIFINYNIAATLRASGQFEQARQLCASPAIPAESHGRLLCLAKAYHGLGRQQEAERALEQYKAIPRSEPPSFSLATVYAQWGNKAAALEYLANAWKQRDPAFQLLRVDWELDPIRNEPQFKAIEARMNFSP